MILREPAGGARLVMSEFRITILSFVGKFTPYVI
jgi:hypothetical protein